MKKFQFVISILELLLGIYGLWWILNAIIIFIGGSYAGSYAFLFLPIGIPLALIGFSGVNRLRGKSNWSMMKGFILLLVSYNLVTFILSSKNLVEGASLIDVYRENKEMLVFHFIVIPVLTMDLVSVYLINIREKRWSQG